MNGKTVSEVYKTAPTKILRGGPVGEWAYTIRHGPTSETRRFDTHDEAVSSRMREVRDENAMERALDEVMVNHERASVTPRDDGGWDVIADQTAHYIIDATGDVDVQGI